MTPEPLSRPSDAVLVRVSPVILEHLKTGDVEPVVILGVQELEDGTYDMTLKTSADVHQVERLRQLAHKMADTIATFEMDQGVSTPIADNYREQIEA